MSIYSIISIILFFLSGALFVSSIVVFITTDVWTSIRYLSNKEQAGENNSISSPSITIDRRPLKHSEMQDTSAIVPSRVRGIEYAQQTIDTDELDAPPDLSFETQDWNLPEGVSFVLTKNVLVCHSEKEYILREN